jgi:hypothetical protein
MVEQIVPLHLAESLTYLKLSGLSLGLIINWKVILLRDGIQRVVRNYPEELGWDSIKWLPQLPPLFLASLGALGVSFFSAYAA